MTLETFGWIVFLFTVIGIACYALDADISMAERELNKKDWRSDCDRSLDRRRAERDAITREDPRR